MGRRADRWPRGGLTRQRALGDAGQALQQSGRMTAWSLLENVRPSNDLPASKRDFELFMAKASKDNPRRVAAGALLDAVELKLSATAPA